MPTIGLDKVFYAKITDTDEGETYGKPVSLAKAISADLGVEFSEAELFADDVLTDDVKEFKKGSLKLNVRSLKDTVAADLLGAEVDESGVLISTGEDAAPYVAVGFRAKKSNGKYRYFWLYRVRFGVPGASLKTKGDSINFATPEIEGKIMARVRPDTKGKHPWKAEVTEGESAKSENAIKTWFDSVYGGTAVTEPAKTEQTETEQTEPTNE